MDRLSTAHVLRDASYWHACGHVRTHTNAHTHPYCSTCFNASDTEAIVVSDTKASTSINFVPSNRVGPNIYHGIPRCRGLGSPSLE